ncbi:MAG: PEP-CTERM sorting domain-containing protein [Sedimentisphaerales bacterium]|nr:PEP-CTERM sorting domain-containing protein [Sedimentisphaerales bacterium]
MNVLKSMVLLTVIVGLAGVAVQEAGAGLAISIGVRETGTAEPIGGNGGAANGIEFIDMDAQTLTLDGTWQQFTFNFGSAAVSPFAGATANGVLDGTRGVLEHIRIRNVDGFTNPITLWIDDIVNTTAAAGDVLVTGFEGYDADAQVIFRQPSFSGSTAGNLAASPNFSGVDNSEGYAGDASYRVELQFVDDTDTRWVRLTSYNTSNLPNPAIDFGPDSSLSFWVKGVPEPTTILLLGVGTLMLRRRR